MLLSFLNQIVPLVVILLSQLIAILAILFRRLSISILISFGIILSVGGAPTPPALRGPTYDTASGIRHSWCYWEQNPDFSSSLGEYAKAAHEKMDRQCESQKIQKTRRPCAVASLWVKNKGIYSASDLGPNPRYMSAELQPKTEALLKESPSNLNRGGSCSCIQAIDGFYRNFPNDVIPNGSRMAIYGSRAGSDGTAKLLQPCRATKSGRGCRNVLSAAAVQYHSHLDSIRSSNSHKRPLSDTGSEISPPCGRPCRSTAVPDLNLPPESDTSSKISPPCGRPCRSTAVPDLNLPPE